MSNHAIQPPTSSPKTRPRRREIVIPSLYQVVAECRNEAQQRKLYEQLTAAGYVCKVMTL